MELCLTIDPEHGSILPFFEFILSIQPTLVEIGLVLNEKFNSDNFPPFRPNRLEIIGYSLNFLVKPSAAWRLVPH